MRKLPFVIQSFADVESLLAARVPENLHLEYKSGRFRDVNKFKADIPNDVAAFANADGGTILIGVREDAEKREPEEIDGVDESKFSQEQLDQTIRANVHPRPPGMRIKRVTNQDGKVVYAVMVPASNEPPHQGLGHKYYRRYEVHNQPLVHHEIEDLRRRRLAHEQLVVVSIATRGSIMAALDVCNPGMHAASDIKFEFSSNMHWPKEGIPRPLQNGIGQLGPGQRLRYRHLTFPELLKEEQTPATFSVRVEYLHPVAGQRVAHEWPLDFESYRDSMSVISDADQRNNEVLTQLKKLTDSVVRIRECLDRTLPVLAGPNGLDLSVWTLRNLRNIAEHRPLDKISPNVGWKFFQDAFGIDQGLAWRLEQYFLADNKPEVALSAVEGMTPELLAKLDELFQITEK